jgi:Creatinase/Prolidase N-terminal domain
MRRGLISRSLIELPDAVLDARIARTHAALREAGLDALLVYTNNTRTAGASWFTGFVPYWSEALLVLLGERPPVLVAALTYRVKSWIERTSRVADVVHTPRVGLEAARMIAGAKADAAVGIADLGGLAAGIVADLRTGGPRLKLHDATALFERVRGRADPAEIALAMKAATIARQALAQVSGERLGEIIAAVERTARVLGAEEIYVAAAPDLARDCRLRRIEGEAKRGESFAVRVSVGYKGTWVRLVRSFMEAARWEQAAARFAAAVAELPQARGFAGFSSWLVEGCRIAQPLEPLMGSRMTAPRALAPGALVSVQASLTIAGQSVLLGAPALLGKRGEAASLLVDPRFD